MLETLQQLQLLLLLVTMLLLPAATEPNHQSNSSKPHGSALPAIQDEQDADNEPSQQVEKLPGVAVLQQPGMKDQPAPINSQQAAAVQQGAASPCRLLPVWTQASTGEWVPQYRVWWVDAQAATRVATAAAAAAAATPQAASAGLPTPALTPANTAASPQQLSGNSQQHSGASWRAAALPSSYQVQHHSGSSSGSGGNSVSSNVFPSPVISSGAPTWLASATAGRLLGDTSRQHIRDQVSKTAIAACWTWD
jgi:hypothetical protein